jgi:hypothetical protein
MELGFLIENGRRNLGFRRGLDCGVCVEVEGTKMSWRPNKSSNICATTIEGVT